MPLGAFSFSFFVSRLKWEWWDGGFVSGLWGFSLSDIGFPQGEEDGECSYHSFPDLALRGGGQWDGGMVFVELCFWWKPITIIQLLAFNLPLLLTRL